MPNSGPRFQDHAKRRLRCAADFPERALLADETPPQELINFLALQLQVPASAWDEYAQRDETRREHLLELQSHYGIRSFTLGQYRSLAAWLLSTALQTNRGFVLVRAAIEESGLTRRSPFANLRQRLWQSCGS